MLSWWHLSVSQCISSLLSRSIFFSCIYFHSESQCTTCSVFVSTTFLFFFFNFFPPFCTFGSKSRLECFLRYLTKKTLLLYFKAWILNNKSKHVYAPIAQLNCVHLWEPASVVYCMWLVKHVIWCLLLTVVRFPHITWN